MLLDLLYLLLRGGQYVRLLLRYRHVAETDGDTELIGAKFELELFFPEGIVEYDYAAYHWIYDPVEELKKYKEGEYPKQLVNMLR